MYIQMKIVFICYQLSFFPSFESALIGESDDIMNGGRVGQKHYQPINTNSQTTGTVGRIPCSRA